MNDLELCAMGPSPQCEWPCTFSPIPTSTNSFLIWWGSWLSSVACLLKWMALKFPMVRDLMNDLDLLVLMSTTTIDDLGKSLGFCLLGDEPWAICSVSHVPMDSLELSVCVFSSMMTDAELFRLFLASWLMNDLVPCISQLCFSASPWITLELSVISRLHVGV